MQSTCEYLFEPLCALVTTVLVGWRLFLSGLVVVQKERLKALAWEQSAVTSCHSRATVHCRSCSWVPKPAAFQVSGALAH
jgi:hypothetical protein